jgi:hypothetical protein
MSESTTAGPRPAEPSPATQDSAVRPFRVGVPDEDLVELRRRIEATRWPERETVDADAQGVPLATMQRLARYWATEHDWHKVEARLNALPQFTTELDGLDIHFLHVRSQHASALPLIVTHGWPGSIIEQLKIIGPSPIRPPTGPARRRVPCGDPLPARSRVLGQADHHRLGSDPGRAGLGRAHGSPGLPRFVAQGGDWGRP